MYVALSLQLSRLIGISSLIQVIEKFVTLLDHQGRVLFNKELSSLSEVLSSLDINSLINMAFHLSLSFSERGDFARVERRLLSFCVRIKLLKSGFHTKGGKKLHTNALENFANYTHF